MSLSRQKRKKRLVEHMARLGYMHLDTQQHDREFLRLSNAHRIPLRFKIDPLLESLVAEFAQKKWKLKKHEIDWAQLTKLQFSSRKTLSKWLQTTGKVLEEELWSKIAKSENL